MNETLPITASYWRQTDRVSLSAGPSAEWASRLPRVCQGSKADRYLTSRGVGFKEYPADMRQDMQGNLLCLIRDQYGTIVSYQRTFLKEEKNGAWQRERKMMRNPKGHTIPFGSSIRLGPESKVMGCAEGVESALSAFKRNGIATWSTISAVGMAHWKPPYETSHLYIFKDNGLTGDRAANDLRFKCHEAGIVPYIIQPPMLSWRGQIAVTDQNTLRVRDVKMMAEHAHTA